MGEGVVGGGAGRAGTCEGGLRCGVGGPAPAPALQHQAGDGRGPRHAEGGWGARGRGRHGLGERAAVGAWAALPRSSLQRQQNVMV